MKRRRKSAKLPCPWCDGRQLLPLQERAHKAAHAWAARFAAWGEPVTDFEGLLGMFHASLGLGELLLARAKDRSRSQKATNTKRSKREALLTRLAGDWPRLKGLGKTQMQADIAKSFGTSLRTFQSLVAEAKARGMIPRS